MRLNRWSESDFDNLLRSMRGKLIGSQKELEQILRGSAGLRVQTVNLHHVQLALENKEFNSALESADLVTADGWPVRLALSEMRPERVAGSDFVRELMRNPGNLRLGLLGGSSEAGVLFSAMCSAKDVVLAFQEHGSKENWHIDELAQRISDSKVDLLLVSVTPPAGDIIGMKLVARGLSCNVISVGGSIDMLTGLQPAAPNFMKKVGLEWLFRLASNPRRLFARYVLGGVPFFLLFFLPHLLTYRRRR